MKRISILVLILSAYFVTAAWSQQPATRPPIGRHVPHLTANQARTPDLTASRSFHAQANPDHAAKIWELGTYTDGTTNGTWFSTVSSNNFGVLIGLGDVPPVSDGYGYTHLLAIPLFGPHAGEWIDLGTLGGLKGWDYGAGISDTGLVATHALAADGQLHGVAWTTESGWVDLVTLADTGDPRYGSYNSSFATDLNRLGTLIPGWSGVDGGLDAPVAWMPSHEWKNGQSVTKWKIRKLDTTALPELTGWASWSANDYGQILGQAWKIDGTIQTAVVWNPRADGKGWKLTALPLPDAYPFSQAYRINNRGEIIGSVAPTGNWSTVLPVLWKPLNQKRTRYSQPIMLPLPNGGFTSCWGVALNDVGDMVGDCWDEAYTMDLPTRWSTKNLALSEIINFPADWGFAWGVNNSRIVTITYTGGEKCAAGVPWTYTCGGAIQLH